MGSSTPSCTLLQLQLLLLAVIFALVAPTAAQSRYQQRKTRCLSQTALVCFVGGTNGHSTNGTVMFTPTFKFDATRGQRGYHVCRVRVRATLSGLSSGLHGFHIHAFGDVRAADGSSTGGHFSNPAGDSSLPHAYPDAARRHWGDLGNVAVNGDGMGTYDEVDPVIELGGIVGRGMTIHEEFDQGADFQPSGNAGPRVGACVIGFANPDVVTPGL